MWIYSIQAEFYTGEPHPPNHASTPGAFLMASVAETREAPSIEGASFLFGGGQKKAPSVVSENAWLQ